MRIGDFVELEVGTIGARGDGIALHDDARVFLPFTVPGDRVRARLAAKRGDGFTGDVEELLSEGKARRIPDCRHFGTCGGCALQHVGSALYADWKRDLVIAALRHRGFEDVPVEPCIISPPGTRRRAKLSALRVKDRMLLGFHGRGSDKIVDLSECPVMSPALVAAVAPLRKALSSMGLGKADIAVLDAETGVDLTVETKVDVNLRRRETLADLAAAQDFARVSWAQPSAPGRPVERDLIVMRRAPVLRFAGVAVTPPPDAFVQTTKHAEDVMTSFVSDVLSEASRVADLFAGCGTFTFPLAHKARVTSIDGDGGLVAAAREGANHATGLKGITFETRDLFRRPLMASELKPFDGLVFDPPRQGAKAQAEQIASSKLPIVAAVSCDPGTFARDARILVDGGYTLMRVQPIDQFLWSPHIELVAEFKR